MLQREATALRTARDALALSDARRLPRRAWRGGIGQMRRGDG